MASIHQWLASLEATQLAVHNEQEEHPLQASIKPHESYSTSFFLATVQCLEGQVARYQQLSGENLPDFIKLTAVMNGLKGNVRHFVLLSLDGDSSFGDLDSLLESISTTPMCRVSQA